MECHMKPSHRIKTIKAISEALALEDYGIIDLTLGQFELSTSDSWRGSKVDYIIEMVKSASDSVLDDLYKHINEVGDKNYANRPKFWKENTVKVFISHLASNKIVATQLQNELSSYGISSFVAHEDIEPTLEWQSEIELALRTMDVLVVLLTPGFHNSNWTDQEIGFALGRSVHVVAVRMGMDPYGFIGKTQGLNGNNKEIPELALEIVNVLIVKGFNTLDPAKPDVDKFVNSGSFASAKKHLLSLESYDSLSLNSITQIEKALKENNQVYNSIGVPARVERLIKKYKK